MEATLEIVPRNKNSSISLIAGICSPISYIFFSVILALTIESEKQLPDSIAVILYAVGTAGYFLAPIGLAIIALAKGISGFNQIKVSGEKGRGFAISGIVIGGFVLFSYVSCTLSLGILVVISMLSGPK